MKKAIVILLIIFWMNNLSAQTNEDSGWKYQDSIHWVVDSVGTWRATDSIFSPDGQFVRSYPPSSGKIIYPDSGWIIKDGYMYFADPHDTTKKFIEDISIPNIQNKNLIQNWFEYNDTTGNEIFSCNDCYVSYYPATFIYKLKIGGEFYYLIPFDGNKFILHKIKAWQHQTRQSRQKRKPLSKNLKHIKKQQD